ncbi:MAG: hypothetical protein ACT4OF_14175 [Caulobacteraceae bacterium]
MSDKPFELSEKEKKLLRALENETRKAQKAAAAPADRPKAAPDRKDKK